MGVSGLRPEDHFKLSLAHVGRGTCLKSMQGRVRLPDDRPVIKRNLMPCEDGHKQPVMGCDWCWLISLLFGWKGDIPAPTPSEKLQNAAKQFCCTATGRYSIPKGMAGRDCPCPPCMAQKVVLEVAKVLSKND